MKLIPLTQGQFAQVDDEDYEYLNQWKWYAQKSYSYKNRYYAVMNQYIFGKRKQLRMHRFIMNLKYGNELQIDHINHNGLDNQKSNLRICTHKQNSRNKSSAENKSSNYLGVSLKTTKRKYCIKSDIDYKISTTTRWCSQIRINNKIKHIGLFKKETDAALAYNKMAKKHFGSFANLNIIT